MIIYKDITTGDEVLSDVFDIKDVGNGLWEVDCRKVTVGGENFALEGANASAEGEDADEGGDSTTETKLDIEVSFRLQSMAKPDKKIYQAELKKYLKAVQGKLKEKGEDAAKIKQFQTDAPAAMKKILANWDNYDVFAGESMGEVCMWVLVDYREDGVTPYATVWKWGLEEMKV